MSELVQRSRPALVFIWNKSSYLIKTDSLNLT